MSKNLAAFASPHNSPWITIFLSCFFFPCRRQRYGQPNPLFDTLQLALSHLLLSPASNVAHMVRSSRDNYDIAIVYAWDKPLTTVYHKLVEEAAATQSTPAEPAKRRSTRKSKPKVVKPAYELDTHTLLHIRNFWHRHLIEEDHGFAFADLAENTYGRMAQDLARAGLAPKQWEKPLKQNDLQLNTEWYGHYSTLAQWPKKRQELEEVQSLAADWNKVDPLVSQQNPRFTLEKLIQPRNLISTSATTMPKTASGHRYSGIFQFLRRQFQYLNRANASSSAVLLHSPTSHPRATTDQSQTRVRPKQSCRRPSHFNYPNIIPTLQCVSVV